MSGKIASFHKTVRGHLHVLKNTPCEDYSVSFSDKNERYHIIAIADGHGDCACMRSAYGSQTAVEVAVGCLKSFAESALSRDVQELLNDLSMPKTSRQIIKRLTDAIISRWYQEIHKDLKEKPLTEEELSSAEKYAADYRAGKRLEHVYGTTLLTALQLPNHLILIQQGDGRCEVFYTDGSVDQPIPWGDRCFENVTTSMCDEDVATSIRHCIIPLHDKSVAACYIGSDGVEDSYRDMEGTHTFYRNISQELIQRGIGNFEKYLDEWLPRFSADGSGDDISIAGLVSVDAVEELLPLFCSLSQQYKLVESKRFYDEKINSMTRKHSILKKRMDDAYIGWEELDALFQDMQRDSSYPLGVAVPSNFALWRQRLEVWERYQVAKREFCEYDCKYQELLKTKQDINSQINKLLHSKSVSDGLG